MPKIRCTNDKQTDIIFGVLNSNSNKCVKYFLSHTVFLHTFVFYVFCVITNDYKLKVYERQEKRGR